MTDIATGRGHSLGLTASGDVYSWGSNDEGQLGIETPSSKGRILPALVQPRKSDLVSPKASKGEKFLQTYLLREKLSSQGESPHGYTAEPAPSVNSAPSTQWTIRTVKCGCKHSIALDAMGRVWCWGSNSHGQLGRGTPLKQSAAPHLVGNSLGSKPVVEIAAGWRSTYALTEDSVLFEWGARGCISENQVCWWYSCNCTLIGSMHRRGRGATVCWMCRCITHSRKFFKAALPRGWCSNIPQDSGRRGCFRAGVKPFRSSPANSRQIMTPLVWCGQCWTNSLLFRGYLTGTHYGKY